ncbi:MAG TPA: hypothetical protein VM238_16570 [Phycisphaerae bacterium]|nr:hypothetical protein [Phycisphaerae bacterium]
MRVLADCEIFDEVEAYEWPDPDYMDFGPCLIVSPSHEALLPNVPPENVRAMAEAAIE